MINHIFRLALVLACLFISLTVHAHQQKQAITTVLFNPRTANIEVMHRFEIHDAEHAVKEIFGGDADILTKLATQQAFSDYVSERFALYTQNKNSLDLKTVGFEVEGKHFWVYQETPAPAKLAGMYVEHNALRDIWHSQTNTLNVEGMGELQTLTFSDNIEILSVTFKH